MRNFLSIFFSLPFFPREHYASFTQDSHGYLQHPVIILYVEVPLPLKSSVYVLLLLCFVLFLGGWEGSVLG